MNMDSNRSGLRRSVSFTVSLALHIAVVAVLLALPAGTLSQEEAERLAANRAAQQKPHEHLRIIWLRKADRLPLVDSGEDRPVELPKAPEKSLNTLFTNAKRGAQRKQFIFTDLPQVALQPVVPSPNVVSFAGPPAPAIAPPPPPKPAPRKFQAPAPAPKTAPALIDLADAAPPAGPTANLEIPVPTPLEAVANPRLIRPPARKFVLPGGGTGPGAGSETGSVMDAPASVADASATPGGGMGTTTLAIISDRPANVGQPPAVKGNRPDAIQTGGVPGGSANGGVGGKGGAAIPGLTVRGDERAGTAVAVAGSGPSTTPVAGTAAAIPTTPSRLPPAVSTATVSVPQWPNARRVPASVESAFHDRPVYATVVSMPNGLPDGVLWFSEIGLVTPGLRIFMRPPVPRQLAWASGVDSASQGAGKAWVRARMTKEGSLVSISINEGGDASLAAAIPQILGRWLFTPAIRNGEVIEADVLLEMTFVRGR
jgi:hypothetical protein